MKAIRIDKEQVIHGSTHINLVLKFMEVNGMTEDAMDKMIEDGRVEFGSVFLNTSDALEWEGDTARNNIYKSVDLLMEYGIEPMMGRKER